MIRLRLSVLCLVTILCVASLSAATITTLIPGNAPHGARVIILGAGLDTPSIAASFTGSGGEQIRAMIANRSESVVELEVPSGATSGPVTVTIDGQIIGTVGFSLAADPPYAIVRTLVRSESAHDVLKGPAGNVVLVANGNTYVADTQHHQIRVIGSDGTLGVVIGTGRPGRADGPLATAEFQLPSGVALDEDRKILYVADTGNHLIRAIGADGIVTTLAGSGRPGLVDGQGPAASFNQPTGLAVDADGNLLVADTGNDAIRRVTSDGIVSTFAGGQRPGLLDGPVAAALFHAPQGVAVRADGALFVADSQNHVVRMLLDGTVSTIAGDGTPGYRDGKARDAQFHLPTGITIDEYGTLVVADQLNNAIRAVSPDSIVTTITGGVGGGYLDGPLGTAAFNHPSGVMSAGAIYIADTMNDAIRTIERRVAVTAVYPAFGPLEGGNAVRLFGAGFQPGRTTVRFGTAEATVVFVTSTLLQVTVPPGTTGAADISVTTPAGSAALSDAYTYIPGPTISSITPTSGPTAGGQSVTVTGSNFVVDGTRLSLGDHDLSDLTYGDISHLGPAHLATTVSGTTPAGAEGTVALRAVTPAGEATLSAAYEYIAPPIVTGFSPVSGFPGTTITITGEHFRVDGTTVRFGELPATILSASDVQLTVTVPTGAMSGRIVIETSGGTASSTSDFVVPVLVSLTVAPSSVAFAPGATQQFTATGTYSDGSTRAVTPSWTSSNSSVANVNQAGLVIAIATGSAQILATIGGVTGSASVQVESAEWIPPDPATIAPPVDTSIAASFQSTVNFLYQGPNPVQRDVAAGAVKAKRVCVLRGEVSQRDGQPLSGVTVTILGSPELGYTRTRSDGRFDIAVNGGGTVILEFAKSGYIPSQRQIATPWRDFASVPAVVMIPYDSTVTAIDFGATSPQMAQSSVVTDEDGTRTASVVFMPGTQATIVLANGTTQPASMLHVRATEYTVGQRGLDAMPAPLPPSSAYTYCVELSADEAPAGASIRFSQPVVFYVDNFLNFPAGTNIPVGSYDRAKGVWLTEETTRVIRVLSTDGGIATLDTNGDGAADTDSVLDTLGITTAERTTMTARFTAGQTLWRHRISHFTPVDHNAPILTVSTTPEGAVKPSGPITAHDCSDCTGKTDGSIIETDNRVLGEAIPITGTPYVLRYSSARVPGRVAARTIDINLTGATPPPDAIRVDLVVEVAGKKTTASFAPAQNLNYRFTWDGKDAYGRNIMGTRDVKVTTSYVYNAVYINVSPLADFGAFGTGAVIGEARREVSLSSELHADLRPWDARGEGLGGWALSTHHTMDVEGGVLMRGDGSKRTSAEKPGILSTIAGREPYSFGYESGDGTSASLAYLANPTSPVVAPDGSIFFISRSSVRKIDSAGILRTLAPFAPSALNDPGDGRPAIQAGVYYPEDMAVGPDGSIYVTEPQSSRVLRVTPDGIMHHVAGNGAKVYAGDNGPAKAASFASIRDIAVGPDSSVYIADTGRIRRVDPAGIISTVATVGTAHIAVGTDGSIYYSWATTYSDSTVKRIAPDGTQITLQQAPITDCPVCVVTGIEDLAIGPDGDLYVQDMYSRLYPNYPLVSFVRIVRIAPGGSMVVVNGRYQGTWSDRDTDLAFGGDESFATHGSASDSNPDYSYTFNDHHGIAIGPDGAIYIGDFRNRRIRRVSPSPFKATGTELRTTYGGETIVFDDSGRHSRTLDPITSAPLLSFSYNTAGRLLGMTDVDGNATAILPSASDVKIVAPGGQTTTLILDGNGWLSSIANPAGETTLVTMSADGLLENLKTPRGKHYDFTYDDLGRLVRDTNPASGYKELESTTTPTMHSVTLRTAMGRAITYLTERLSGGVERRTTADNNTGLKTITVNRPNASGTTEITNPDGSKLTLTKWPDAFFGMEAPVTKRVTLRMPSGLQATATQSRSYTRVAGDLNRIAAAISETAFTGVWQSTIDVGTHTMTTRAPSGRIMTTQFDAAGRITQSWIAGITPSTFSYDSHGRLQASSEAGVSVTYGYDARNRVSTITDTLARTVRFEYDDADRPVRQILPGQREVAFSYDANGNLASVSPPGRPAHTFVYTPVDAPASYTPPVVPNAGSTTFGYNPDQQLTMIHRPDGREVGIGYDTTGRMISVTIDRGTFTADYNPATGQLRSMTAPDQSVLDYTYDGPLPTSVSQRGLGSVSWTWDYGLRVTQETVNGTNAIAFGYDADDLLTRAGALTIARVASNGLTDTTALSATTDKRTWKPTGRLDAYAASVSGTPVFSQAFTYDAAGRITEIAETRYGLNVTKHYDYDDAGRLWKATTGGVAMTYLYDANANRTSKTIGEATTTATYDDQDRLSTYGDTTYSYNAAGDLFTTTDVTGTTRYAYDELGNLLRVDLPDGRVIEYLIDAQNRRVGEKVNGNVVARWLYADQLRIVAELDGTGNVVARFVYATRSNVPDYMTRGTATYRIISDHLGSPQYVLDSATGAVIQSISYDEFGNVIADSNPGFQPFGFAGGLYDRDTRLVRFGARDYDAQTGRWTTKDPILFAGLDSNLYGYVSSDPVNSLDFSGLVDCNRIPVGPRDVDIRKNIAEVRRHHDPWWFKRMVQPGGPWDYKRQDALAMSAIGAGMKARSLYEDFGNFHFAVMAAAFGFPEWFAKEEAGRAQKAREPYFGHNWSGPPWGDDLGDARLIELGYDYYEKCICGGK